MRIAIHRHWILILAAAWGLANAGVLPAPITSELQVQKVQAVDGDTNNKPASVSKPGDVLEYHLSYSNHTSGAVSGLVAKLPIPVGTTLTDLPKLSPDAEASTDGTHFAPLPLTHVVKRADGSEQRVAVPLEEYRSLRWNLGTLPANAVKQVQARVRVNPVSQAAAPANPAG
ncbi:MAG: hypothetical protein ABSG12_13450 [Steroidobacteraceae bacterium]|jgi:hypothetical protein